MAAVTRDRVAYAVLESTHCSHMPVSSLSPSAVWDLG